jgi:hypothetical protein
MTQPQGRRRVRRRSTDIDKEADREAVLNLLRRSSTEPSSTPQDIEIQPQPQGRRRVRKRSTDIDKEADREAIFNLLRRSSTEPSPTPQNIEIQPQPEEVLSPAIATVAPAIQIPNDDLDPIRTELLNDLHHQNFSESDYWDESHNWSNDGELASDEYWHFLGLYE